MTLTAQAPPICDNTFMPINNIQAVGDDQAWKREAEIAIRELQNQVALLTIQTNSRGTR